jgi:chromosome segregation ATPase
LEVDGGSADEDSSERQAERASIANTIEITDAIVAEKDCEIAALRAQLVEAASRTTTPDQQPSNAINELLDADEVIKQHRERIAQLERETEAKLREAELELSVERAKIGRQRAELDQLQSDLKAQRASLAANGAAVATGAPRRRWLSKLGLGGEDGQ